MKISSRNTLQNKNQEKTMSTQGGAKLAAKITILPLLGVL